MSTPLDPVAVELLRGQNFAHVATVAADGSPQVSPVWVDFEDGAALFNTRAGTRKERNLRRHPLVALAVSDVGDPYRYVELRGPAELSDDTDLADIDRLCKKYTGRPFPRRDEQRVSVRVRPAHVVVYLDD